MSPRSSLAVVIVDYLALKQALGRRFVNESGILACLDRFLTARSFDLTPEAFAAWCLTLTHLSTTTRRSRMRIVRNFCLYMRRRDPD